MKTDFNILVIGDVMIDQYMKGTVTRRSPEADIPVLEQVITISEPGGAANVAMNAAMLGSSVTLLGVTGSDSKANKLVDLLKQKSIRAEFITDDTRPTTVKTRVFNGSSQIVRVDEESTSDCNENISYEIEKRLLNLLSEQKFDIAILQDYNKGVLHEKNIETIVHILRSKGIFIAVDPKKKNFTCYEGVDLFKPNLSEMLHWTGKTVGKEFNLMEIKVIAENLRKEIVTATLLVTLSENGALLTTEKSSYYQEAIPLDIVDVCGAGDAVITVSSMALKQGLDPADTLRYCVESGKIVCEKVGVSGITSAELHRNFI